jgi:putative glutamine amidotransferase
LKKLEKVLAVAALSMSLSLGMAYDVHAMVGGKPVIGISWKSNKQDYTAFKKIIELPVVFLWNWVRSRAVM